MSGGAPPRLRDAQETPQALIGFRTNGEWTDLLAQTAALIDALDTVEDAAARKAVFDALAAIDAIHREALHRLVRLFKEGVLAQVVTDPAIRTLMGMYDLLPEPEPGCRKVWDFTKDAGAAPDVAAGPAAEPPHWSPAPLAAAIGDGEAAACRMEEGNYILVATDGRHFAFAADCAIHRATMAGGGVDHLSWICPNGPGCIYDLRSGARLGGGPALDCRPVRLDAAGRVLIGFGMPFEPKLPAF